MIDWDKVFAEAHLHVWPPDSPASLCISNRNPNPTVQGSRNIFKDDEKQIMQAAEKHGFKMLGKRDAASVSFVKSH